MAGAAQLAPLLARAAVQRLLGQPANVDMGALSLDRAALSSRPATESGQGTLEGGRPSGLSTKELRSSKAALGAGSEPENDTEPVRAGRRGDVDTWEQLAALQAAGTGLQGYEARLEAEESAAYAMEARTK